MGEYWIALGKIGGLALVGGLIDLGLRRAERDRVINWMTIWWDRFDSVKWSNFSQREARAAINVLDRVAGSGLWSWQRWRFVLSVSVLSTLAGFAWSFYQVPTGDEGFVRSIYAQFVSYCSPSALARTASTIIAFAGSISITRFVSAVVASLSLGRALSVVIFICLLLAQVAIYVVWTVTVMPMVHLAAALLSLYLTDNLDFEVASSSLSIEVLQVTHILPLSYYWGLGFEAVLPSPNTVTRGLDYLPPDAVRGLLRSATFGRLLDLLANGLRILFALVFVASFVFRPLIQAPISRVWAGLIESGKATFATLFGVVGAIIVFAQACAS